MGNLLGAEKLIREKGDEEMKICPECGKKMIKRYENYIYPTNPPQRPWYWWCGCGYREDGGIDMGFTEEEIYRLEWEIVNKEG